MAKPKRHPADEPIPGAFLSNDPDILPVHVDPPTSTGKDESTPKHGGTDRIPTFEEPTPKPGKQLPGSDGSRTGAGHDDPVPPPIRPDGF